MTATPLRSSDAVNRVALVGALLPTLLFGVTGNYEAGDIVHFTALIAAIAGTAAVLLRARWAGAFTLLTVLCISLRDRATQTGDGRGSDVLLTTAEAIAVLFSHQNPYAHTYAMTRPPGGLFAYPPGEIVFYTLAHLSGANIFRVDLGCSILALGIIAAFVPLCGTGLAALAVSAIGWPTFITIHLADGSNDNAAAFLTLVGFAALVWSAHSDGRARAILWWFSAFSLGWALAFKEYTLPIVFFIAVYLWRTERDRARGWVAAMLGTAAVFVVPFVLWNPGAFFANVAGALVTHRQIWGRNVWHDWLSFLPYGTDAAPLIPIVMVVCLIVLGAVLWKHPARSLSGALLQGLAAVTLTFLLARWTTSVYYCFLAPLLVSGVALQLGSESIVIDD